MTEKLKVLAIRFLRGLVAGAVATMLLVAVPQYQSWNDIQVWLIALAMAGAVGAISGLLQAIDKAVRWSDEK